MFGASLTIEIPLLLLWDLAVDLLASSDVASGKTPCSTEAFEAFQRYFGGEI